MSICYIHTHVLYNKLCADIFALQEKIGFPEADYASYSPKIMHVVLTAALAQNHTVLADWRVFDNTQPYGLNIKALIIHYGIRQEAIRQWVLETLTNDWKNANTVITFAKRCNIPYLQNRKQHKITPLMAVVVAKDIRAIQKASTEKKFTAQAQLRNLQEDTALGMAIGLGDLPTLTALLTALQSKKILEECLSQNNDWDENNALGCAVAYGNIVVLQHLFSLNLSHIVLKRLLIAHNYVGDTVLMTALDTKQYDILQYIMQEAVNRNCLMEILKATDQAGDMLLHRAINNKDNHAIHLILTLTEYSAQEMLQLVHSKDGKGIIAMNLARAKENYPAMRLMMAALDHAHCTWDMVNAAQDPMGDTALQDVVHAEDAMAFNIIINAPLGGITLFMHKSRHDLSGEKVVELLATIEKYGILNETITTADHTGRTAAVYAVENNNYIGARAILRTLINGQTPLMRALSTNNLPQVKTLLSDAVKARCLWEVLTEIGNPSPWSIIFHLQNVGLLWLVLDMARAAGRLQDILLFRVNGKTILMNAIDKDDIDMTSVILECALKEACVWGILTQIIANENDSKDESPWMSILRKKDLAWIQRILPVLQKAECVDAFLDFTSKGGEHEGEKYSEYLPSEAVKAYIKTFQQKVMDDMLAQGMKTLSFSSRGRCLPYDPPPTAMRKRFAFS